MNDSRKAGLSRILSYKAMVFFMQLCFIASVLLIIIFLISLAVPYMKNALTFQYIRTALRVENSVSSYVQGIMPTRIYGINLTKWIVIVAALFLAGFFSNIREHYRDKVVRIRMKKDYEDWKEKMNISDNSKFIAPLKAKIEKLQTDNKVDREELLKLFAETKRKLDSMGRDLAFLAIDVVDSTGMKEGEERPSVEHDFREYKQFVESRFRAQGLLKSTWTPDGVMSCFPTVDQAVKAAQEILGGLESFNAHVKTMRRDFRVRCGINYGYVYFDETMPLEELSDRVIDVAGHMQKHASPNTICIAKPAIEPLKDREGFVPISKVVDGYEVYMAERRKAPRE